MAEAKCKIAIVGEAQGLQESIYGKPFIGAAGELLNKLLFDAGLLATKDFEAFKEREEKFFITNVFDLKPPADDNNILSLCVRKRELPNGGKGYNYPALTNGWFVKPEYLPEIARLKAQLEEVKPNIVIGMGNTALWALTGKVGIDKYRGALLESSLVPGLKCIFTYHPASLFRNWSRRSVVVLDLAKSKEEAETPERNFVSREVWLEPTLVDLEEFEHKYIDGCSLLSFDIETSDEQITCIALAPDPYHAIVLPFVDERKAAFCYWPTRAEEVLAWKWLKKVLEGPIPKLAQNGMYDTSWLRNAGVHVRAFHEDTMLLHHALQPEERKGLGVLASLYAKEDAFKQMGKAATKRSKRDG